MKKLILMAAALVFAASVQAASADWKVTNIYKVGSTSSSTTADRVDTSTYYGYLITVTSEITASSVSSALASKSSIADVVSYLNGIKLDSSATTAAGKITKTVNLSGLSDGDYQMFTVLLDSTNGDPSTASNYLVGDTVGVTVTSVGDSAIGAFNAKTATQTAANWHTAAVPEPTSGLLMLLGVAGLALRRRRA